MKNGHWQMTSCEMWTRHDFLFADAPMETDNDYYRTCLLSNELYNK